MLEDSFIEGTTTTSLDEKEEEEIFIYNFISFNFDVAMGKSRKTTLETSIRKFLITFCCKFIIGCYFFCAAQQTQKESSN